MKVLRVEVAKDCTAVKGGSTQGVSPWRSLSRESPAVAVRCDPLN